MKENDITGFLLVNKPSGPTSHDIVYRLRRITGVKKIGHAGTLDPFARGLLIMAIGRKATREIGKFVKLDKTYVADLKLGATSDTHDRTGEIQLKINPSAPLRTGNEKLYHAPGVKIDNIVKSLDKFTGKQKQVPPMYSAKKIKGQRLYKLARKGIEVKREPVEIEIFSIKLLKYKWPDLQIEVQCSSGTYIRSLAHDIGEKLGCGAYLEELKRTAIGKYQFEDAVDLDKTEDIADKLFF